MLSEHSTFINPTSAYPIDCVFFTFHLEIVTARYHKQPPPETTYLSAVAFYHVRSLCFQPAHQERYQRVEDRYGGIRRQNYRLGPTIPIAFSPTQGQVCCGGRKKH
jgi:hypothetical protein